MIIIQLQSIPPGRRDTGLDFKAFRQSNLNSQSNFKSEYWSNFPCSFKLEISIFVLDKGSLRGSRDTFSSSKPNCDSLSNVRLKYWSGCSSSPKLIFLNFKGLRVPQIKI